MSAVENKPSAYLSPRKTPSWRLLAPILLKFDACVKSRFRLRYEIVKSLRIAADPQKNLFLAFSGPFDRELSFAKSQKQAEIRPYWPFRIRSLAFLRMPMLAEYSSRLFSVRSNGILADYLEHATGQDRFFV